MMMMMMKNVEAQLIIYSVYLHNSFTALTDFQKVKFFSKITWMSRHSMCLLTNRCDLLRFKEFCILKTPYSLGGAGMKYKHMDCLLHFRFTHWHDVYSICIQVCVQIWCVWECIVKLCLHSLGENLMTCASVLLCEQALSARLHLRSVCACVFRCMQTS